MNCAEFEDYLDLLDRTADDLTRQRALNHASACASCSRLLSDERAVNSALSGLALETEEECAPPRVKAAMLESFSRMYPPQSGAVTGSEKADIIQFPSRLRGRTMITLAVAASILALIALSMQLMRPVLRPAGEEVIALVEPSIEVKPAAIDGVEPKKIESPEYIPEGKKAVPRVRRRPAAVNQAAEPDFIPLTWVSDTASLRSGTVVRVEVERATLLAMGLPVNETRSDSLIKADLVVGDDGIARAIRFVQ